MRNQTIVVSAAIVDLAEKRLFMQRRGKDAGSYQWCWVTPGGKRNVDESGAPIESLADALNRELCEEHGIRIKDPSLCSVLFQHVIQSTRTSELVLVQCYLVYSTEVAGEYKAGPGVAGFDWVNANELETLMLGPADSANRGKLLDLIR